MDRPTKKELKEQRKLERLQQMEQKQTSSKIKWIIVALVSAVFLGFFIFLLILAKQNKPVEVAVLSNDGQKMGSESAKVTLVEFSDFQCPACKAYEPVLKQVREAYGDDLLFIYKHYPLPFHKNAFPAAVAAEAAGLQGKFWEYHDVLFENQEEWANLPNPRETFIGYASSLELDTERFEKDLGDKKLDGIVNAHKDEGGKIGVNATPTFYLNGAYINVNSNLESFQKVIDEALLR